MKSIGGVKAFDHVKRSFIIQSFVKLRFGPSWQQWIKGRLSPSFSVLVNGSPQGLITSSRGIRQGDPLSPYIFCIIMESLSIKLEEGLLRGTWHSYRISQAPMIPFQFFEDDVLLFIKPTLAFLQGIWGIF